MLRLTSAEPDFDEAFARIVADRREEDVGIAGEVATILARVKAGGDGALAELTRRFDDHELITDGDWAIPLDDCEAAYRALDCHLRAALDLAAARIRAFHESQRPADHDTTDAAGVRMGARWRPVDAAGLYVPGGRAAYPSSLLMNAIPAKVAGVARLAVATPTPAGRTNPLVLAAAHIAGVDEIWRIGGAQAIGALAYGTTRIAPVDVVTGPGNAWVAEAKRQLYGTVGIDMVAGPSEILVIADKTGDPAIIAADLIGQAEHDPAAQSILITDDRELADAVARAVETALPSAASVAGRSWRDHGVIIDVADMDEAVRLANALAAEHVELIVADPEPLLDAIRHAGSVFIGPYAPEAIGDYLAGPNHVLPTGRRARFASGLSVLDFMKRTSFIELGRDALEALGPAAIALAEAEGLPAHARSIALRLDSRKDGPR